MILWLLLFLLVVGISFILAFRSMNDYQEIPQKTNIDYGLFLVRQTGNLNTDILDSIGKSLLEGGLIISIERLFKGKKTTLTIFGPKNVLDKFTEELNLLELEDYARVLASENITVWEVGVEKKFNPENLGNIFANFPKLEDEDQFFWQMVLGAKDRENSSFQTQIRAAVSSKDPIRKKMLASSLQNLNADQLVKIPKPFSNEQMLDLFKSRSLGKVSNGPVLDSEGVMRLIKV